MVHSQMQEHIIFRWMSLKSTIEYIGEWESLNNPSFNYTEFGTIRNASGSNNFVLSVKTWIEKTNAIGIAAKAGRYGGTYAHKDIAFSFAMWLSPAFQLYCVKELQRLKAEESNPLIEQWNVKRILSKTNYQIHTDNLLNLYGKAQISPGVSNFGDLKIKMSVQIITQKIINKEIKTVTDSTFKGITPRPVARNVISLTIEKPNFS